MSPGRTHKEGWQPALVESLPHELVTLDHSPRSREGERQCQLSSGLRQYTRCVTHRDTMPGCSLDVHLEIEGRYVRS